MDRVGLFLVAAAILAPVGIWLLVDVARVRADGRHRAPEDNLREQEKWVRRNVVRMWVGVALGIAVMCALGRADTATVSKLAITWVVLGGPILLAALNVVRCIIFPKDGL